MTTSPLAFRALIRGRRLGRVPLLVFLTSARPGTLSLAVSVTPRAFAGIYFARSLGRAILVHSGRKSGPDQPVWRILDQSLDLY